MPVPSENLAISTPAWVAEFRAAMPVVRRWAYFDHAAVAPLPEPTAAEIARWANEASSQGDTVWHHWAAGVETVRGQCADAINAEPDEIALVPNTTAGIQIVATGLRWRKGDNVVVPANEFPSNLYPWLALSDWGVETRRIPFPDGRIDIDRLAEACDERTRIVSCSWVGYASGWRIDVGELCRNVHARGGMVFLDAIQGLGVFPLDVRATEVDFVAADGHKWLLGPEGAGVFFCRRDRLEELRPVAAGWNSVVGRYDFSTIDFSPRPSAARFEGGSQNMVGTLALGKSLEVLRKAGWGPQTSVVADRVLAIADHFRDEVAKAGGRLLNPAPEANRSGIVGFDVPGVSPTDFQKRCRERFVAVSVRGAGVRASLHAYNTTEDVARLAGLVRETVG